MARGKRQKAATKMKIVKPSKSKPSVGQKKKKVQPKNDSRAARNVQDKSVRTKRKKAVNNNLMGDVDQMVLGSQNKISPAKKRKLEHINEANAFDSDKKKIPVEIREEAKQKKKCMEDAAPFEMTKSKEKFRLYKQVYINVTRLDKNILNEANISIFNSERKAIVAKKMNGDIGTDNLKDKRNNENLEKILELEQNIEKLKSEKVILEDDNGSKNEVLNCVIKEKEEYKEKFVNEVQKCNEMKVELERVKSSLTMLKCVKEEVEARKNKIGELVTEKEALEAEMKNKDKTLKLVRNEASLKFKDASEKLTWVVELNQELKEEVEELQNSITSMKAKHKIDHDLLNTTIEELMAQAKSLTLSNNQMMGKVVNLTKQLDLKDLKIQKLSKQLEEVNKRAESLSKLYEEKRNEVESLIEKNEEKDKEWDNIFKKSEEQMEELGLLLSQFKQKTYEVEIVLNQTQEKQKQLKRITRQNKEESQELEGSVSEMEKERDSLNSQEERRTVDENTAKKAKALQDKEISVNRSKEDSEEFQNLKAQLTTVKTYFQHFFQKSSPPKGETNPSHLWEDPAQSSVKESQPSLPECKTNPSHFWEEPALSSIEESQPFDQSDSIGIDSITVNPNDQATSFTDDDNSPDGPASLSRSKQLGKIDDNSPDGPASLTRSKQLGEMTSFTDDDNSPDRPAIHSRSKQLGEIDDNSPDGPASLSLSKQLEEIDDNSPDGPASLSRSKQVGEIASFTDDDNSPDGPASLSRSKQLGEIASFTDDNNTPDGPASLSRSKQLGEIASELRDEVMQLLPPIQEKEAEDKRMIENARQILQDVIEYRKNLDEMKKQCAARLSQVSKVLALKNN